MNAAVDEVTQGGGVLRGEPMRKHTSWRVGGPADLYFKPRKLAELTAFLASLPADLPMHWVGLGSNLLVRDGGIRGAVIATSGLPKLLERVDDLTRARRALACRARCLRANACAGSSGRPRSSPAFRARSAARSR